MSHSLIVGITESGKSTIAKGISRAAEKRGFPIVVYDPMGAPDWPESAQVCSTWAEFHKCLFFTIKSEDEDEKEGHPRRPIYVFVDEADTVLSQSDRENWWLLTRGRHYGCHVHCITQRPKLVAPTVRGQCSVLYCFAIGSADARELGQDFGAETLAESAPILRKGEFLKVYWAANGEKTVDKMRAF